MFVIHNDFYSIIKSDEAMSEMQDCSKHMVSVGLEFLKLYTASYGWLTLPTYEAVTVFPIDPAH